ncbi:hypothetical protein NCAS_0D04680 [Naumovozyma castellii]|uniref:Cell division control protein 50 n=1 Tax=Naumovozyma castellii TaxID=27288 RepID=G0VEQ8_NAUCA|nr:hypothetical protein NCAS_0D04680 [Naumovozyma castellii CBS 4309]CCC70049.1 hypothetical protein NCAS_0D04680 [Naumovozyma castellii CBS 4309]
MKFLFWRKSPKNEHREPLNNSRKPPNTAFRQQRLKAWQPILSPRSVLPLLICVVCIFLPIGIGLIIGASKVQDMSIDYSKCDTLASKDSQQLIPSKYVRHHFKKHVNTKPSWILIEDDAGEQTCQIHFEIPNEIKSSIYVYYKLSNFFQNHRKYVESYDHKQLKGKPIELEKLNTNCKPLRGQDDKIIYPCGLIANSMFNDTFAKQFKGVGDTDDYILTNKKISWSIDRHRFQKTKYNASDIVPPPNWAKKFPDGYTDDNIPDIHEWEELQVWMRTAPFPKFYKLALKNESMHLPKGNYSIDIGLNYPVSLFGGSKSLILTTITGIGGRNVSLGVVFLIVTCVSGLFAIIFLVTLFFQPRTMGDRSFLNFDDEEGAVEVEDSTGPLREIL